MVKVELQSVLAAETGGPITDTADRIEGEFGRAGVLGSDHLTIHHAGAGDELLARVRMWEVALVEATYRTSAGEEKFAI